MSKKQIEQIIIQAIVDSVPDQDAIGENLHNPDYYRNHSMEQVFESFAIESLGRIWFLTCLEDELNFTVEDPEKFFLENSDKTVFDIASMLPSGVKTPNQVPKPNNNLIGRLPYTRDFLFVDEILEITDHRSVQTKYIYQKSDPIISGHMKGIIVPGNLLTEQVCQSALLLTFDNPALPSNKTGVIIHSNSRYFSLVVPNREVIAYVELTKLFRTSISIKGECYVDDKHVATVTARIKMSN